MASNAAFTFCSITIAAMATGWPIIFRGDQLYCEYGATNIDPEFLICFNISEPVLHAGPFNGTIHSSVGGFKDPSLNGSQETQHLFILLSHTILRRQAHFANFPINFTVAISSDDIIRLPFSSAICIGVITFDVSHKCSIHIQSQISNHEELRLIPLSSNFIDYKMTIDFHPPEVAGLQEWPLPTLYSFQRIISENGSKGVAGELISLIVRIILFVAFKGIITNFILPKFFSVI